MMTTDKKIERIKEINDFIINQELTKLELERYVAKLNYLKKEFSQFDRNYYQLLDNSKEIENENSSAYQITIDMIS